MKRIFILFSNHGRTRGDWRELMAAGRLDIVVHSIISAFFLAKAMRRDTRLHVVLNGPPDPPKHIQFDYDPEMPISKKDIGNLLRATLWKYKPGRKVSAFPGIAIEKLGFEKLIEDYASRPDCELYLLDPRGLDIAQFDFPDKELVFVLGDHEGIPKPQKRRVKKRATAVLSIGPLPYFTSQCITVVNNFLDRTIFG